MIRFRWTLTLAALLWSPAATAANWVELARMADGGLATVDLDSVRWLGNIATVDARLTYDPPRSDGVKTATFMLDLRCADSTGRMHSQRSYDATGALLEDARFASDEFKQDPDTVGGRLQAKICSGHKYDPYAPF